VGAYVFATGDRTMEGVVGGMLKERGLTLSLAESCTGGLIGNLMTNVPGSSEYFMGGVVAYSNQAKKDLLGVSPETLDQYGAVSDQTVREMAACARERFRADLSLAVSGIAGPDGGSPEKPVGTVLHRVGRPQYHLLEKIPLLGHQGSDQTEQCHDDPRLG
jgi:nicotinamide-nucleotide amidase